MSDYVLSGDEEQMRLQLQARMWESYTEAMLDTIGVQPGWSCVDIGCGAMGILGPLSRRVGAEGHVIGIDTDDKLIAAAHKYLQDEALHNVEIKQVDAFNSGLPRNSFDLVHERFVFSPVGGGADLLEEMIALTKPGGIVATQETNHISWTFYPPCEGWTRLLSTIEQTFLKIGADGNVGQRTFQMMRDAGMQNVQFRAGVLALQDSHPYMRMALMALRALRKAITGFGLMTDDELDTVTTEIEAHIQKPDTVALSFTLMQVWGVKPE